MEIDAHIEAIRIHGSAMAEAAAAEGPDLAIPTCPGWTMRDLVHHTGEVHRWAEGIVGEAMTEAWNASPQEIVGEWPDDAHMVSWFQSCVDALVTTLERSPPDLECWTFMPAPSPLAFWARRQAHEIAIHRSDAELPNRTAPRFEPQLAADGIDELLVASLTRRGRGPRSPQPRTLVVDPTDSDDRWLCRIGESQFTTERSSETGDCTVQASTSDLYMFLWNRIGRGSIEVVGDDRVLDIWRDGARI